MAPPAGQILLTRLVLGSMLDVCRAASLLPGSVGNFSSDQRRINRNLSDKKHIFFSWSAGFRVTTNGSEPAFVERPHAIVATGTDINGTLDVNDFFPDGYFAHAFPDRNSGKDGGTLEKPALNGTLRKRVRRGAREDRKREEALLEGRAEHEKNADHEVIFWREIVPKRKKKILDWKKINSVTSRQLTEIQIRRKRSRQLTNQVNQSIKSINQSTKQSKLTTQSDRFSKKVLSFEKSYTKTKKKIWFKK